MMLSSFAVCTLLLFTGSVYSIGETPLPGGCGKEFAPESIDTAEILRQLNSGEYNPSEDHLTKRDVPVVYCEEGPLKVEHTVPDTIFFPRIYKESCNGLGCKNALCSNKSTKLQTQCVHVFKVVNGQWLYQGQQVQIFESATSCVCKTCRDFTQEECGAQKKCPESAFPDNFCYWIPHLVHSGGLGGLGEPESLAKTDPTTIGIEPYSGRCECCTPKECAHPFVFNPKSCSCVCNLQCAPGLVLDQVNCRCMCPRGTYYGPNGDCIGECSLLDARTCSAIKCADNPELNCFVNANKRCQCPSCDAVPYGSPDCTRTKCSEQKSRPYCKVDPCSGKCRCPNCEEQPDPAYCSNTYCGDTGFSQQCRWDKKYNKCSC